MSVTFHAVDKSLSQYLSQKATESYVSDRFAIPIVLS
jgi:hypothetical protein